MPLNSRSQTITQGVQRAPNRSMLRAVGFTDGDFEKPIVGIASAHSTITPCNMGIRPLAERAERAIFEAGGMPQTFGTITVSDGISMGTEGMKYSLVSREVIADSIETAVMAQSMDGALVIGGCDKNMPGGMIGIARMNIPAIFVYGGTIKAGKYHGRDLNIVSVFEAVGAHAASKIDDEELRGIECHAIPGAGSCGGMYTANTMSSAIEAMGMSLSGSSTMAAIDDEKAESAAESGRVLVRAIENQLLPRQIMTRKAFENAIAVVMATGGSTNAVLHLLAIAHAAEVPLAIEDFEEIRQRVPVLCDLKPSGKYLANDFHHVGGVPLVMKMLLEAGLLHGDCLTITGQTVAEVLADVPSVPPVGQDIVRPIDQPIYAQGHLAILKGNLATEGAVAKITGVKSPKITGPARVFESEEESLAAISRRQDSARRRARDSLRRAEGRAGDARDARPDVRDHRRRARRFRRPDHRTDVSPAAPTASSSAMSRRKLRLAGRSAWSRKATASPSMRSLSPSPSTSRKKPSPSVAPSGRRPHRATRAASSPSTASSLAPQASAPSRTEFD